MAADPNDLGKKPVTRQYSWLDLCMRSWGAEFNAPDHGVYVYSNGRKFDSTDKGNTGIYGSHAPAPSPTPPPPPAAHILTESSVPICTEDGVDLDVDDAGGDYSFYTTQPDEEVFV